MSHKLCVEVSRALQLNRDSAQCYGACAGGETLVGEVLCEHLSIHSSFFCLVSVTLLLLPTSLSFGRDVCMLFLCECIHSQIALASG